MTIFFLILFQDPPTLIDKQREEWLPIIQWFSQRHAIEIQPSESTFTPIFSPNAKEVIRRHLLSYSFDAIQGRVAQCGNFRIFLQPRFYVKSISSV